MKLTPAMVALLHEVGDILKSANAETDYDINDLAAFGNAAADANDELWMFVDRGGVEEDDE